MYHIESGRPRAPHVSHTKVKVMKEGEALAAVHRWNAAQSTHKMTLQQWGELMAQAIDSIIPLHIKGKAKCVHVTEHEITIAIPVRAFVECGLGTYGIPFVVYTNIGIILDNVVDDTWGHAVQIGDSDWYIGSTDDPHAVEVGAKNIYLKCFRKPDDI